LVLMDGGDVVTVTAAPAILLLSATLVAVTVIRVADAVAGAVNRPFPEMLPAVVDQFTAVSLAPLTAALNCCDPPGAMLAVVGEIAMLT
jgi:hypothetical protein